MKWLLHLFLVVAAGVGFTLFFRDDPGFIVVSRGNWTLETSLALFILGLAIAILAIYLFFNFLGWLGHFPSRVRARHGARRQQKSHQMLQEGMLALWREQWQTAEQLLAKSAFHSAIPALHYLGAAFATLHLPDTKETQVRTADYFDQAREEMTLGEELVFLLQAKVQQRIHLPAALNSATRAYAIAPQHPEIIQLLITLYQQCADWKNVLLLLPEARKYKLLSPEQLDNLEIQAQTGLLQQILQKNAAEGASYWARLSKSLHSQPELIVVYAQHLANEGEAGRAEILLREALEQQWNSQLINTYGQLRTIKPITQIHHAEQWLKSHFNDVDLLLALGRLCIREKMWDKAEQYLKSALHQSPANQPVNPVIYQTLGDVLSQQGDAIAACEYYRQALGVWQTIH
jgi:HemY protein